VQIVFGFLIEYVFLSYNRPMVSHNGIGFDGHVLDAAGFTKPPKHLWHDTLMMSRIIDSRGSHTLESLANKYLGVDASAGKRLMKKAMKIHGFTDMGDFFANVSYDVLAYTIYSANDVILTARIYAVLLKLMDEFATPYEREIGAWHVTAEHEGYGLDADIAYADELYDEWQAELRILHAQLKELGIENPKSTAQQIAVLMEDGWEPEEFTEKSGKPKLDKKIMEQLDHEVVDLLLEYNRIHHWLAAYIRPVRENSYCGKIYPSFNPFGAKTGRQSVYGPPLQQLPSRHDDAWKIRRLILPRPNEQLWSIDYDAQENRLLAHYSQCPGLLKVIRDGLDIHRYTASHVYNIGYDEVTKDQRALVKNVVYAQQYGAGIKKLMKMLNMTETEVRIIKEGIERAYPGVTAWKKKVEEEAAYRWKTEGQAYAYTWGGRRVYADQFEDKEPAYYTLTNYILQGTAADILKEKLNTIAAAGLSHYILFPVHDELLFSLPTGPQGREIANELAELMAMPDEFIVPMTCSPEGPYESWGHKYMKEAA
jgi:DNA polymerase-1